MNLNEEKNELKWVGQWIKSLTFLVILFFSLRFAYLLTDYIFVKITGSQDDCTQKESTNE